ncbi:MAG: threonine-phosphate decarboxylase [Gammaproteobacteria bacterium]|jgi:threonine-phosphate decarboxylase
MRDLDTATREQLYDSLATAHGGYWRHGFADHAYLYNLYFPPERFFDLIKSKIHELVSNYPVGQDTLSGWVGELIGKPSSQIVVGNGAAELIKIVSGHVARKLLIPVPSFNEYANAAPVGSVVEFALDTPSFQLDVDKYAARAIDVGADVAVVVTPNNPTSLSVPKDELLRLATMLAPSGCMLIVDESFIDFSNDVGNQTLEDEIDEYPNLVIFKSMSKAYGICGIRIGYMLTANVEFAAKVRSGLHIWNVNGFAETFLEAAPAYRAEFETSCARVRADCDEFYERLQTIDGLFTYKPDANFVFCRVDDGAPSGPEIARRLFVDHNAYTKHCAGKNMLESDRFLRIASRTPTENEQLASALEAILSDAKTPSKTNSSADSKVVHPGEGREREVSV